MDEDAVAVVGMACRFAGASTPSKLWDLVLEGRSAHSTIPARSFNGKAWYHSNRERAGAICTISGHFLDGISHFDSAFFSIGVEDAEAMDPMQRLGLEVAYEGFENAGLTMRKLARSRTAVYAAVMTNDYQLVSESDIHNLGTNAAAGTGKAMLSNRISWFFDLKGPSLTLDTACSSGLYALHLACCGLKTGECDQALVTGTNLILHPSLMVQLSQMHMISPDGVSHSFDASANGYGRGEGVASLVVKRFADAIRDGDVIRAVIRASGANHDGKTTSITMPSEDAQAELIRATYRRAKLPLSQTSYFEAHGTGTPQGDPIEVRAIAKTLGAARLQPDCDNRSPLFLGSVKTNLGHTEGCAGLAGVIKAVQCIEAGWIPAVVGLKEVNPEIAPLLSEYHLAVPTANIRWPDTPGGVRRASVNSFGFGGSNCHVVLDDAASYLQSCGIHGVHATKEITSFHPSLRRRTSKDSDSAYSSKSSESEGSHVAEKPSPPAQLYLLSAHDEQGLNRVAQSYSNYLDEGEELDLTRLMCLAHILAARTSHHYFRGFTVAGTHQELSANLSDTSSLLVPRRASHRNKIIFVFTGQGAQRPGMARELLIYREFASSIEFSQKCLDALGCQWKIIDILCRGSADTINRPEYSQPLCTAVQIALVHLLSAWGVQPAAVVGHSSGEIVAALAAGAISHEDAIRVSWFRGQLSADLPKRSHVDGTMLAAGLSELDAADFISRHGFVNVVNVACVNSPSSVTLAGPRDAITNLHHHSVRDGHFSRILRTSVAYHSSQMAALADDYAAALATLDSPKPTTVPMYSSVTEELIPGEDLIPGYWLQNMKNTVRFSGALGRLLKRATQDVGDEYSAILEIGPTKTLEGPIRQIVAGVNPRLSDRLPYLSFLIHGQDAHRAGLQAAGQLWATGHSIDIDKVNQTTLDDNLLPVLGPLLSCRPTYPWSHKHVFWHESTTGSSARTRQYPRTDLLGVADDNQNPFEPRWRNILNRKELPWLSHHDVGGAVLFPAAGYLAMALEAVMNLVHSREGDVLEHDKAIRGFEFLKVHFESGLVIPEGRGAEVSLTAQHDPVLLDVFDFAIYTISKANTWTRLCNGHIQVVRHPEPGDEASLQAIKADWRAQQKCLQDSLKSATTTVGAAAFYSRLGCLGLKYGPTFQGLAGFKTVQGRMRVCGTLKIPDTKSVMPHQVEHPLLIHPATLDSAFQLVFASLESQGQLATAAVPIFVRRVFVAADIQREAGSVLIGMSEAHRVAPGDNLRAETERFTIRGDVTFMGEDQANPKIVIEDIRLQDISSGSQDPLGRLANSSLRRSARVLWKEDVDHLDMESAGFKMPSQWPELYPELRDTHLKNLCVWLDRLCHKHSGLNAAFIGVESRYEEMFGHLFGPEDGLDGRFSSITTSADIDVLQSQRKSEYSSSLPYNIMFLGTHVDRWSDALSPSLLSSEASFIVIVGTTPIPALSSPTQQQSFEKILDSANLVVLRSSASTSSNTISALLHDLKSVVLLERDSTNRPTTSQYCRLRDALCSALKSSGILLDMVTPSSCTKGFLEGRSVISLLECGIPWVHSWSSGKEVEEFRDLVTQAQYILWVTTGGIAIDFNDGETTEEYSQETLQYAPTTGLLRSVRAEYPHLSLPHLDISFQTYDDDMKGYECSASDIILKVLASTVPSPTRPGLPESEFTERKGRLLIPRVVGHPIMDNAIQANLEPLETDDHGKFWLQNQRDFHVQGLSRDEILVQLQVVAVEHPSMGDHSYRALVHEAIGNFVDSDLQLPKAKDSRVLCVLGQHGVFDRLGRSTMTGTIDRLKIHAAQVLKLPEIFRDNQCLVTFLYWLRPLAQAWNILNRCVSLYNPLTQGPEGDSVGARSVLVDIEDSLLREAVVYMCQLYHVQQVFTIGKPRETQHFPGNATHIPRASHASARSIRKTNGGKDIDAIITSLQEPENAMDLVPMMAYGGRLVLLDANPLLEASLAHYANVANRNGHVTVECLHIAQLTRECYIETYRSILRLVTDGSLQPGCWGVPENSCLNNVALEELKQPLKGAEGGMAPSRCVLSLTMPQSPSPSHSVDHQSLALGNSRTILDPKGTYVIAGGLGALGLEVAAWLFEHSAGRVLLLSRSGQTSNPKALEVLNAFSSRNWDCRVLRCDITDQVSVCNLASTCTKSGWLPIRGIIQSAMVLQDSMLENMTIDKWLGAVNPKTRGSWNLHQHLDLNPCLGPNHALDFFILFSSVSGIIGNTAQSNYSAGNAFEDALAHYRQSKGLAAMSLNLGLVSDARHFGGTDDGPFQSIESYLAMFGHLAPVVVSLAEIKAALATVVREAVRERSRRDHEDKMGPGTASPAQVVVGISDSIPRHDELLNKWPLDRKFDHRAVKTREPKNKAIDLGTAVKAAKSVEDAALVVEDALRAKVATAVSTDVTNVDPERPLSAYGVDSLKAAEVRNWLISSFKAQVSIFVILSPTPISKLAHTILQNSKL